MDSLGLPAYTLAGHYRTTRRALERGDLFDPGLSPATWNRRRKLVARAYSWANQENPWAHLKPRKKPRAPVEVFKPRELRAILAAIQEHHGHYWNFVRFLMASGCRFGEAAGVLGRNIDLEAATVTVSTSVRRNIQTNRQELRRGTKTETVRVLESPGLMEILEAQGIPEDLGAPVFTTVRGCLIRRSRFRKAVWVPALESAGVPYRRLHILRHTALSMALVQGLTVPEVAYLAGHRDSSMVLRTYGHILERPGLPAIAPWDL